MGRTIASRAVSPMTLWEEVNLYNKLRSEILSSGYELTGDDQALLDTLEGETDVHEQLAAIIREAERASEFAAAIKRVMMANQDRKARFEWKYERLRKIVFDTMQQCGIKNISQPDLTITVAKGTPHVIITDAANVPDNLCKIERTPKKREISELLKFGEPVSYAYLSNSEPVLKVNTR